MEKKDIIVINYEEGNKEFVEALSNNEAKAVIYRTSLCCGQWFGYWKNVIKEAIKASNVKIIGVGSCDGDHADGIWTAIKDAGKIYVPAHDVEISTIDKLIDEAINYEVSRIRRRMNDEQEYLASKLGVNLETIEDCINEKRILSIHSLSFYSDYDADANNESNYDLRFNNKEATGVAIVDRNENVKGNAKLQFKELKKLNGNLVKPLIEGSKKYGLNIDCFGEAEVTINGKLATNSSEDSWYVYRENKECGSTRYSLHGYADEIPSRTKSELAKIELVPKLYQEIMKGKKAIGLTGGE